MLYYSYQWFKTAKDHRQLLTVTRPLRKNDKTLCNLFIQCNEKVHGNRPTDNDRFIINPSNTQEDITIERVEFFKQEKDRHIALVYHTAMSMAISGDILTGLEKICTEGPLWLSNFIIHNWLEIHEKNFNRNIHGVT